jgi:hypothetical protein
MLYYLYKDKEHKMKVQITNTVLIEGILFNILKLVLPSGTVFYGTASDKFLSNNKSFSPIQVKAAQSAEVAIQTRRYAILINREVKSGLTYAQAVDKLFGDSEYIPLVFK